VRSLLDTGASRVFVPFGRLLEPWAASISHDRLGAILDQSVAEDKAVMERVSRCAGTVVITSATVSPGTLAMIRSTSVNHELSILWWPSTAGAGDLVATMEAVDKTFQMDTLANISGAEELLGQGIVACMVSDRPDGLVPTVVSGEDGRSLGLVYSSRESVLEAIKTRAGVYQSRGRGLWRKGETSGAHQALLYLTLDCDRDALLFTVRQHGDGFCHRKTRHCFGGGSDGGIGALWRMLESRLVHAPEESYTKKLFENPGMLKAKIIEEANELVDADSRRDIAAECADLFYFAAAHCVRNRVPLLAVESSLSLKARKITRRPGLVKPQYNRFESPSASSISDSSTSTVHHLHGRHEEGGRGGGGGGGRDRGGDRDRGAEGGGGGGGPALQHHYADAPLTSPPAGNPPRAPTREGSSSEFGSGGEMNYASDLINRAGAYPASVMSPPVRSSVDTPSAILGAQPSSAEGSVAQPTSAPASSSSSSSAAAAAKSSDRTLLRKTPQQVDELRRNAVDPRAREIASKIVDEVRFSGWAGLVSCSVRFGDIPDESGKLVYTREELKEAYLGLPESGRALLERVAERISVFAKAQLGTLGTTTVDLPGGRAGQNSCPVDRAGCYAPGGRYPLPSSVLMTAVTARAAGVSTVWVASPKPDPMTLGAAYIAGADGLLAAGGAQAIAALAYGAGPVPPCDCVVGPGNKFVTAAKSIVFGRVSIDMLAGPSEVLVFADDSADPGTVAADMLAQAEHDPDALAILVATSEELIDLVDREVKDQLAVLPTQAIAARAIANSFAVKVKTLEEGVAICNILAPEHLQLLLRDTTPVIEKLRHYGALFIGHNSAEVFGDYGAGPNHTLPTSGTAKYSGGLSVFTFLRIRTWLEITDQVAAQCVVQDSMDLALVEGLHAHHRAAKRRLTRDAEK
jgi:histidinol dehydrogenase/phosphoribosyl-ATP pyrophosphohydrolase